MTSERQLAVIRVSGTPRERGLAIGTLRSAEIRGCIDDWLASLSDAGVHEPHAYLTRFLADTDFLSAIGTHTPDLLDEVLGMAEGAGVPRDMVLAAQFMDEEWAYRIAHGVGAATDKCSSLAVRSDNGAWIVGQNMDLGGYTDGHQVVTGHGGQENRPDLLVFSLSNMIGLMGVNAAGLAVVVNAIPQLPAARTGLPVAFVLRGLLARRSVAEAVRFLRSIDHASPQHYLIADFNGARTFEVSAETVVEVTDLWPSAAIAHTNHPLAPELACDMPAVENSVIRLASLEQRIKAGGYGLAWAKAALSSADDPENPVSRTVLPGMEASPLTGMIGFTTGSMISVLDPAQSAIENWVSPGPPSLHGYRQVVLARG